MKDINKKDYEEYHRIGKEENNDKSSIGGTTEKKFVRLDNSLLKGYIKEARKKTTNYVSYIDDFIKENYDKTTKNIPLKYVSVLLKKARRGRKEHVIKEVLGSRLSNLMGVPTVYNELTRINEEDYMVSIDFLKPGQEVDALFNGTDVEDCSPFCDWEAEIENELGRIIKESNPNKAKIIDKFKRDFVKQYIIKSLILDDMDFLPRNVVYIKEKKSDNTFDYNLAPLLDYEFILSFRRDDLIDKDCRENVKYFLKNYPNEIKTFAKNLEKNLYEDNNFQQIKLDEIFNEVAPKDSYFKDLERRLILNIKRFRREFIQQSKLMDNNMTK